MDLKEAYKQNKKIFKEKEELKKQLQKDKKSCELKLKAINKQLGTLKENENCIVVDGCVKVGDNPYITELNKRFKNWTRGLSLNNEIVIDGQKISVYSFFKQKLEEYTGKKLELYAITTPYKKQGVIYDEYFDSMVETVVDYVLTTKEVAKVLLDKSKTLNIEDYTKIIKKLPFCFLLSREKFRDFFEYDVPSPLNLAGIQPGIKDVDEDDKLKFFIPLNLFNDFAVKGIFREDIYNKNDENFELIVLDTVEYNRTINKIWKLKNREQELSKKKYGIEKYLKQEKNVKDEYNKELKNLKYFEEIIR